MPRERKQGIRKKALREKEERVEVDEEGES